MRLELKDIKGEGLEQAYNCSLHDFPALQDITAAGEVVFREPLIFQLRFQRVGQLVEVDGRFKVDVRLQCGRCLQRYEQSLSESFALTFVPHPGNGENEKDEVELEAEELALIGYEDDVLQLREPLQEQVLMAIPISPVCQASCQGLCPECGADLNIEKCNCQKKPFNNKFTVLADIDFESPRFEDSE